MVFSSMTFLTLFLPVVLMGYYACYLPVFAKRWPGAHRERANAFLLVASALFYFWGEGSQVWILAASCTGNFLLAWLMGNRLPGEPRTKSQKLLLVAAIVLNLGCLAYYKYFNFFIDNMAHVFPAAWGTTTWPRVALPLGISFFTFQAMSYVIDVYRGEVVATGSIINFSCFLTMFPQLVAGPIVRYRDVYQQLMERTCSRRQFASGARRFIVGLSKKVLIANTVAVIADKAFDLPPNQLSTAAAWLGIVCYTLQIYYDFSGYSDMAIGLGRMFGFEFLENFNYPYIACSVGDFWRRWHISLSTWFRDYLYRPLGGSRKGLRRTYLHLFIVFFLCGLWHGASWVFVAWGLYHGLFLVLERLLSHGREKIGRTPLGSTGLLPLLGHAYVVLMVMGGWVLFRSATFAQAWGYYGALMGYCEGSGGSNAICWLYCSLDVQIAIVVGALFSMPVLPALARWWTAWLSRHAAVENPMTGLISVGMELGRTIFLLGLLCLCFLPLAFGAYNPFIYFRF